MGHKLNFFLDVYSLFNALLLNVKKNDNLTVIIKFNKNAMKEQFFLVMTMFYLKIG